VLASPSRPPATQNGSVGSSVRYQRREPEKTLLHRIVRENLAMFLAEAADRYPSGDLSAFISQEFERYLRCGILRHGFARVRCPSCRDEILVAFACKNRGVCPSCCARRMADSATHLRDCVLPSVPVRQWVFTLPKRLRFLLAWRPKLTSLAQVFITDDLSRCLKVGVHFASRGEARTALRRRYFVLSIVSIHTIGNFFALRIAATIFLHS